MLQSRGLKESDTTEVTQHACASSLKSWVVKQVFAFERWLHPGKDVRAAAPGWVYGERRGKGVGTAGETEAEGTSSGSAVISGFC